MSRFFNLPVGVAIIICGIIAPFLCGTVVEFVGGSFNAGYWVGSVAGIVVIVFVLIIAVVEDDEE